MRRQVVHAHGGGNQRHIVDDRGCRSDGACEERLRGDVIVQEVGNRVEEAGRFQRSHAKQDAEEKENSGGVDLPQRRGHHELRVLAALAEMQGVREHPHHPQGAQDAQVRRQARQGFEDRHRQQAEDPRGEYQLSSRRQTLSVPVNGPNDASHSLARLRALRRVFQLIREHRRGDQRGDQRWQHQAGHGRQDANLAADPEHRGRDISYRRPRASRVGGHHHERAEELTVFGIRHELLQQAHHDNRGRQVVQDAGHEEGDGGDDPEQLLLVVNVDGLGDQVEALVRVDGFHDGHRSDEEERDLGYIRHMRTELPESALDGHARCARGASVDDPQRRAHEQPKRCLVVAELLLQDDADVPQAKDCREAERLVIMHPVSLQKRCADEGAHPHKSGAEQVLRPQLPGEAIRPLPLPELGVLLRHRRSPGRKRGQWVLARKLSVVVLHDLHQIFDAEDSCHVLQLPNLAVDDGDVPELALGHGLQGVADGVLRLRGHQRGLGSHDLVDEHVPRLQALLHHLGDEVPLGEDAGDGILVVQHQHAALSQLAHDLHGIVHRRPRLDRAKSCRVCVLKRFAQQGIAAQPERRDRLGKLCGKRRFFDGVQPRRQPPRRHPQRLEGLRWREERHAQQAKHGRASHGYCTGKLGDARHLRL
mmetsp:Transcript_11501/g.42940  ORF Transcript_11501/g.42940 Transcript_11501/m.42940 type:complete len:649 (+) Transcript_11501:395-2341(+)